jgi:plastocyanin
LRLLLIPLFVVLTAAAMPTVLGSIPSARAETIAIDTGSNWFCSDQFASTPCVTSITAGDTVTWTVVQGFHTVTQCDEGHVNCGNGFESGVLEVGQSFSQTFTSPGTVSYYCAIHPDMTGVINVQQPTPTPSPAGTTPPGATGAPTSAASPASVPKTGGYPADDAVAPLWLIALAAGGVLVASGASVLALARRR